ncbi:hypothetical protein [uncultured Caballeronia sp.]|uniref:hypothetical protein n=1 Tax=uncultured Caballeronia sp. TaxID=1827198 RepID=UPI0035C96056
MDEVRVRRHGNAIILEPIANDWSWLELIVGPVDEGLIQASTEQPTEQDRPDLDFFK